MDRQTDSVTAVETSSEHIRVITVGHPLIYNTELSNFMSLLEKSAVLYL